MIGPRTRTCIREDGKRLHRQACGAIMGEEYEHDELDWQPPADWPYEIVDPGE